MKNLIPSTFLKKKKIADHILSHATHLRETEEKLPYFVSMKRLSHSFKNQSGRDMT